jgi:hypothetical protein
LINSKRSTQKNKKDAGKLLKQEIEKKEKKREKLKND